jgi:hypothetical protein
MTTLISQKLLKSAKIICINGIRRKILHNDISDCENSLDSIKCIFKGDQNIKTAVESATNNLINPSRPIQYTPMWLDNTYNSIADPLAGYPIELINGIFRLSTNQDNCKRLTGLALANSLKYSPDISKYFNLPADEYSSFSAINKHSDWIFDNMKKPHIYEWMNKCILFNSTQKHYNKFYDWRYNIQITNYLCDESNLIPWNRDGLLKYKRDYPAVGKKIEMYPGGETKETYIFVIDEKSGDEFTIAIASKWPDNWIV